MTVLLKADPNPDFPAGEWPGQVRVKARLVEVAGYAEASEVCRRFIDEHDLGGGNWTGGAITDDAGQQVAYVSYNGRVWEGKAAEWTSETRRLY